MSSNHETLANTLYQEVLDELVLDVVVRVHREEKVAAWIENLSAAGKDIYGNPLGKPPKDPAIKCQVCGRSIGASKFAPHLDKCMGKGGRRVPSRNASISSSSSSSSSSCQQLPTHNNSNGTPILFRNGVPIGIKSNRKSIGSGSNAASASSSSSSSSSSSAFPPATGISSSSSTPGQAASANALAANMDDEGAASDGLTGKRERDDVDNEFDDPLSDSLLHQSVGPIGLLKAPGAAAPHAGGSGGTPKQPAARPRKKAQNKALDFWAGPLPTELPTHVTMGGFPYLVEATDTVSLNKGTPPTQKQLLSMLERVCAVAAFSTVKMCVNKRLNCKQHTEKEREEVRKRLLEEPVTAYVRIKRVDT